MREEFLAQQMLAQQMLAQQMLAQQVLAELVSTQAMVDVKEDSDILEYTLLSLIGIEPIKDKKYTVGPEESDGKLFVKVCLPNIPSHFEGFLAKMMESHPGAEIQMAESYSEHTDQSGQTIYFREFFLNPNYFLSHLVPLIKENIQAVARRYGLEAEVFKHAVPEVKLVISSDDIKQYWYSDDTMTKLIQHFVHQMQFPADLKYRPVLINSVLADLTDPENQQRREAFQVEMIQSVQSSSTSHMLNICFIYNIGGHWVPVQVLTNSTDSTSIKLSVLYHDPFSKSVVLPEDNQIYQLIRDTLQFSLGGEFIASPVEPSLLHDPRQSLDNQVICGPQGVEDIIALLAEQPLRKYSEEELRQVYVKHQQAHLAIFNTPLKVPAQYLPASCESAGGAAVSVFGSNDDSGSECDPGDLARAIAMSLE